MFPFAENTNTHSIGNETYRAVGTRQSGRRHFITISKTPTCHPDSEEVHRMAALLYITQTSFTSNGTQHSALVYVAQHLSVHGVCATYDKRMKVQLAQLQNIDTYVVRCCVLPLICRHRHQRWLPLCSGRAPFASRAYSITIMLVFYTSIY